MKIHEHFATGQPVVSFEFFPPKTDAGFASLFRNIQELQVLKPSFVSVTMGAGGSTRNKTVDLVIRIQREIGLTAMAHLPCVGFERTQVGAILEQLSAGGIENILALRGDPPQDTEDFVAPQDGFDYANELIEYIASQNSELCIVAACYPETHPQAESAQADLDNLKRKVDAGAKVLITQLFFENDKYFRFVERANAAGIDVPIVPGIMPIVSRAGVKRMTALGGCEIPGELAAELDRVGDDDAATAELGVRWGTMQCRELLQNGVPGLHFYTLNKSSATRKIFEQLFPRS
ncbi:MAG: methylenetetrahydrofolate reductase [NAD(P)H] [Myxococcota bacterium]|jgi:methylenetetrahydrofolate reductase (NADPH)|nr:methylenetetrahydrofolate reductase [NAD(P)H] [Myxococcota bacterium]